MFIHGCDSHSYLWHAVFEITQYSTVGLSNSFYINIVHPLKMTLSEKFNITVWEYIHNKDTKWINCDPNS